jgi:hypothetical protein
MRSMGWLVLLLVVTAWVLGELPCAPPVVTGDASPQWSHSERWRATPCHESFVIPRQPTLHPTVVAAFELLVSTMGLLAFSSQWPVAARQEIS